MTDADVWLGAVPKVPLAPAEAVAVTLSREARRGLVVKLRYDNPVQAPIVKGQRLGELEIAAPGIDTFSVPLLAGADVAKAGVLGRMTGAVEYLIWGAS